MSRIKPPFGCANANCEEVYNHAAAGISVFAESTGAFCGRQIWGSIGADE
jgi:hypothetical protein